MYMYMYMCLHTCTCEWGDFLCSLPAAWAGGGVRGPKRAGGVFWDEVIKLTSPSQPRRAVAWWVLRRVSTEYSKTSKVGQGKEVT
jgi:hypothetical protein